MKKCIGIVSYFPDNIRYERIALLERTLQQVEKLFPDIDIVLIAQNYKSYMPKCSNRIIMYKSEKLGITGARRKLREVFLKSKYDYLIMLDDDTKIGGDSAMWYLKKIDESPNKIGFLRDNSLMRLLAISKEMYSKIDLPNLEAERSEMFEDIYLVEVAKKYYPEYVYSLDDLGLVDLTFSKEERRVHHKSTYWKPGMKASIIYTKTIELVNNYKRIN